MNFDIRLDFTCKALGLTPPVTLPGLIPPSPGGGIDGSHKTSPQGKEKSFPSLEGDTPISLVRKNNLYTHLSKPHLTWIHKVLSLFIQSGSPLRDGRLRGTPSQVIRFDRIYPQRLTFGGGNGSNLRLVTRVNLRLAKGFRVGPKSPSIPHGLTPGGWRFNANKITCQ